MSRPSSRFEPPDVTACALVRFRDVDADAERRAWITLACADLPARLDPATLMQHTLGQQTRGQHTRGQHGCAQAGGEAAALVGANAATLAAALGSARARAVRRALDRVEVGRVLRSAREAGQRIVTPADGDWPAAAFEGLADPPCALWLRGQLPSEDDLGVAIVGTRDATPYGLRVARELALGLAGAGIWIVSGLAVGIDGAAHEGALEAGGLTLAVLGCGIDHAYPVAHGDLKEAIAAQGGVLSEHPPGTAPQKWHFPRRNRVVAALAAATIVVEAAGRSGALITARLALDLGREVLAVPGSVFAAQRAGCHRLLRQGAGLCETPGDVLELLGVEGGRAASARRPPTGEPESLLWRMLDDSEALDAAELCRRTGLGAAEVAAALTALELDGHAQRLPGVGFLRR